MEGPMMVASFSLDGVCNRLITLAHHEQVWSGTWESAVNREDLPTAQAAEIELTKVTEERNAIDYMFHEFPKIRLRVADRLQHEYGTTLVSLI